MPLSVEQIDACLPQTQCTRCGYPRCLDYAKAIANNSADIDRCPPGGDTTLALLSKATLKSASQLAPEVGDFMPRQLAVIDEAGCIGCVLCIKACPVDAIIGANKTMHSIIGTECTGCELCLPVCPTDCIEMQAITLKNNEAPGRWPNYPSGFANHARMRNSARLNRLSVKKIMASNQQKPTTKNTRQAEIMAAIKRKQKGL